MVQRHRITSRCPKKHQGDDLKREEIGAYKTNCGALNRSLGGGLAQFWPRSTHPDLAFPWVSQLFRGDNVCPNSSQMTIF